MIAGMQIAPGIDALAKLATARVPALEVAFGRFVVQGGLCLAIAALTGRLAQFHPPSYRRHFMRGIMLAATTVLFVSALKFMPLVDAYGIAFVEPMLPQACRRWC